MIHEAIDILINSNTFGCYSGRVPQTAKLPFVNHFQVSKNNNYAKDGSTTKFLRYQISVFSKTKAEGISISDSIIGILDFFSGHVAGYYIESIRQVDENDLYEDDADVYHRVLDLEIRYK